MGTIINTSTGSRARPPDPHAGSGPHCPGPVGPDRSDREEAPSSPTSTVGSGAGSRSAGRAPGTGPRPQQRRAPMTDGVPWGLLCAPIYEASAGPGPVPATVAGQPGPVGGRRTVMAALELQMEPPDAAAAGADGDQDVGRTDDAHQPRPTRWEPHDEEVRALALLSLFVCLENGMVSFTDSS